jgi:cytochrome c peroxidase
MLVLFTGSKSELKGHAGMNRRWVFMVVVGLLMSAFIACGGGSAASTPPVIVTPPPTTFQETSPDASGTLETFSQTQVSQTNPFFTQLGTNQRTCNSCHVAADGWTINPTDLQQRFQSTQGTDPVFRVSDGANCPSADVSTLAAATLAYSLLLNSGLIRMTLPVPANADFSIISINDPYQCPETTATQPSLYRRPLPSTNLKFLNGIMWDGREPDLKTQAKDATMVHTDPTNPPTDDQLSQIVSLETSLFTAQSQDTQAGDLTALGANGGPVFLSTQTFSPGINSGTAFSPNVFNLYTSWASATGSAAAAQQSVARGEVLFNTLPILISQVPGFNDAQGGAPVMGTCTSCHLTPNVGGDSLPEFMDIGTSAPKVNLPAYTVQCNDGTQVTTSDLGRAMVTGLCADLNKIKVPGMRGLAARPPYFHNGVAADLMGVVTFYNQRFNMALNDQQEADLVAFMSTL